MKINFISRKIPLLIMAACGIGGYFLGIPVMIAGIVLGYFVGCILIRIGSNKTICRYFENPGSFSFHEGEPGLAAFCALGVYLLSKASPKVLTNEAAAARVAGGAVSVFPQGKKIAPYAALFCRLAFDSLSFLNPDLLTESLVARRKDAGDQILLGTELSSMAMGKEAEKEAFYIMQFIDPSYKPKTPLSAEDDPWTVLGIAKGASYDEVKSAFRKLALMFHPDNQSGLNDDERKKMSETFIKIRDAYHNITREN
jgi:DnaJ like chaperone protein